MMQIGAGISAMLVRGQIAYNIPPLVKTLGSGNIGGVPWIDLEIERRLIRAVVAAAREGLLRSAHDVADGGGAVREERVAAGGVPREESPSSTGQGAG